MLHFGCLFPPGLFCIHFLIPLHNEDSIIAFLSFVETAHWIILGHECLLRKNKSKKWFPNSWAWWCNCIRGKLNSVTSVMYVLKSVHSFLHSFSSSTFIPLCKGFCSPTKEVSLLLARFLWWPWVQITIQSLFFWNY